MRIITIEITRVWSRADQSVLSRSVSYSIGHTFHSVAVDPGRVADKVVEEMA